MEFGVSFTTFKRRHFERKYGEEIQRRKYREYRPVSSHLERWENFNSTEDFVAKDGVSYA